MINKVFGYYYCPGCCERYDKDELRSPWCPVCSSQVDNVGGWIFYASAGMLLIIGRGLIMRWLGVL